jgi:glyoxylase-like metal-dependent hydrolase (beta-lactamase superfamily II)
MEEIAKNVYIEGAYPGVILGAFNFDHGLVMIDAPFRQEDLRSWRASLVNLGGGVDKALIMMDTHIDRTLGIKAMETSVVGHEASVQILKGRPTSARSQEIDAGADWEPFDLPSNIRWAVPDMTFTDSLAIYWEEDPIILTHQPGAHVAACWVRYDAEKVVFIGDSVVINQPPFLAWSDLDTWLAELERLQSDEFDGYQIVNGRNGLIKPKAISKMAAFLTLAKESLDAHSAEGGSLEEVASLTPKLMKHLNINKVYADLYENRMSWGLQQYFEQHYLMSGKNAKEMSE